MFFSGVDRFQKSAGILRDWPEARGMYYNVDETLLVWVNEQVYRRPAESLHGPSLLLRPPCENV